MSGIPVLDLSLLDGGPDDQARFRDELRRATHEVGFFSLVGHGVPRDLIDSAYATAREFFALPEEQKRAIENVHSPHFRGWTRMGGERTLGRVDQREQIDIGAERPAVPAGPGVPDFWVLEGPNLWPESLPACARSPRSGSAGSTASRRACSGRGPSRSVRRRTRSTPCSSGPRRT